MIIVQITVLSLTFSSLLRYKSVKMKKKEGGQGQGGGRSLITKKPRRIGRPTGLIRLKNEYFRLVLNLIF
jgi:hypothetical protein